jgi:menaquinol-cytochrome c reductase cytochrome b subunit
VPKLPAPPLPAPLKTPPPRPGQGNGKSGPLEDAKQAGITVVDWVDERTSLSGAARWMMFRKVPKGTNWFYTLGSATMFAFLSQAVTGVFLAMYYRPDPAGGAYESIRYVTNDVFLGQFVRGMHKWGSSVMVVLVFLHMARTFFFGAYKYPRELNWVIGVVLLILTMVMSFTGYLLPFDQRAYWATIVGVNINGTGPLVGPYHAVALLCHPHAARPRPDRRAARRTPVPGRQARHDRAAVDESQAAPRAARDRGLVSGFHHTSDPGGRR